MKFSKCILCSGILEVTVLYKSLFYYILTALPGANWSKLLNLVMSISLTVKVVNPFGSLNDKKIQITTVCCCVLIALLHISDSVMTLLYDMNLTNLPNDDEHAYIQLYAIIGFCMPGLITSGAIYCYPNKDNVSMCDHKNHKHQALYEIYGVLAACYFLVPPLIILVCMMVQVVFLRRNLGSRDLQETTRLIPGQTTAQHVSVTILLVSCTFFICNISYIISLACSIPVINGMVDTTGSQQNNMGVALGITEFGMPLVYAVIYPIILICRKEELKQKYVGYWGRILFLFKRKLGRQATEEYKSTGVI